MAISILHLPQEILQKIALYATITGSPYGPPKALYSSLLTCRTFRDSFSPENAGELYSSIFAHKFDAFAPEYRIGRSLVRENAPQEMRRRFSAFHIFKTRDIYHSSLTEAFWIAYLMVEDVDASQKNVKHLLRAGLSEFLDLYLRQRLYEGSAQNNGWPLLTERNSLALALAWAMASQSSVNREDPVLRDEMMGLLMPIVFAAFRYTIFHTPEDHFDVGGTSKATGTSIKAHGGTLPPSALAPCEIEYFGTVKRRARVPSAAIFASLLYFVRAEVKASKIPPHITFRTRAEASNAGSTGLCIEDFQHFYDHCRTHFADFPAIDVGFRTSAISTASDAILCQPNIHKLGTFSGRWQGSQIVVYLDGVYDGLHGMVVGSKVPTPEKLCDTRKPLYFTLEEHYCYDDAAVVPWDSSETGMTSAWLPQDMQATETPGGIAFSDARNTFHSKYETFRYGQPPSRRQIVDVIITGKTDDQYSAPWGSSSTIIGRIRLSDGLMILKKTVSPSDTESNNGTELLRGYVTSSQNLVGRMKLNNPNDEFSWESIFSLSKNHTSPSRPSQSIESSGAVDPSTSKLIFGTSCILG